MSAILIDSAHLRPLTLADVEMERARWDAALERLDPSVRGALERAAGNIRRFHETQVRPSVELTEVAGGVWCGERSTPIDSVCLYVPRGRGAFSSVACMLGVPAVLAGVPRVVLCTPPSPDGQIDAATLFVARELGIDHVYRVGGAQAIAAVAFGTERVPRFDKVLGPGNVYVSGARQLLAASIDGGPPAGPSESLIVADGSSTSRPFLSRTVTLKLSIRTASALSSRFATSMPSIRLSSVLVQFGNPCKMLQRLGIGQRLGVPDRITVNHGAHRQLNDLAAFRPRNLGHRNDFRRHVARRRVLANDGANSLPQRVDAAPGCCRQVHLAVDDARLIARRYAVRP